MNKPLRTGALTAVLGLFFTQPSAAQVAVDSAGLPTAIAEFVANELVAQYRPELGVVIVEPVERFDTMIARELSKHPIFQRPIADSALTVHLQVRGAPEFPWVAPHLRGLPTVLVTSEACEPSEDWGGGHWWRSQEYYVFKPGSGGWEVAGGGTLDSADGSCSIGG